MREFSDSQSIRTFTKYSNLLKVLPLFSLLNSLWVKFMLFETPLFKVIQKLALMLLSAVAGGFCLVGESDK